MAQNLRPREIKIDHASICGSNLDTMRAGFASLGLITDYGGPHASGGTQMALLGFDDGSYLELIAPQKAGSAGGSGWAKLIAADAGACAWAIGARDLKAEIARLKNMGVEAEGPSAGSRKRPDGTLLEWETARAGPGAPGSLLPFMIEDKSARSLRVQPSASLKGSGFRGIERVVIGVNNLDAATVLFRQAYGWESPVMEEHPEFGAQLAYFSGSPVILAAPLGKNSWLAERLQKFGGTPIAYLLGVQDLEAARRRFDLAPAAKWFGKNVTWFDREKLGGVRLGIVQ